MCGCGCNNCSDSFSGLNGLLGALLPAYSQFRVGFHIDLLSGIDSQAVQDCLWGSNSFYDLEVVLTRPGYEYYLLISGKTVFDFGNVEDVGSYIQQQLESCGLSVKSRDAVAVDSVPEGTAQDVINQINLGNQNNNKPPSQCDWSKQKWDEYLACTMGITPSSAALVGAVAGIGGLFLILTLAKR